MNELIADQINETIDAARETLSKTGYTPNDIESIVWVGETNTLQTDARRCLLLNLILKENRLDVNPITAIVLKVQVSLLNPLIWGC